MEPDNRNVLEYHVPKRSRRLAKRWIIGLVLNSLSGLICIGLCQTIIQAFAYQRSENYAELALFFFGIPAVFIQGVLAVYALILCVSEIGEQLTRWEQRIRFAIICTAVGPFLIEFAFFVRYWK